jgi:head-tail adaptor
VTALDGREVVMDQVLQGISVYRVRIRWRSDLTTEDQLRAASDCFRGHDVNIRSIADPDGRRKQLIIMVDTASTRN